MRDITPMDPFVVRFEDGREAPIVAQHMEHALMQAKLMGRRAPITLLVRADEPWVRHPSLLRRLLNWLES